MTYISQPVKFLLEANDMVGYCAQIPEFQESNSLLQNAAIVAYEVGTRVMAVALVVFATIYSPILILVSLKDCILLNIRVLSERDLLSPAIFNVNIAFMKVLGVGVGALLGSILSPQYVHNELKARNVLLQHLAETLVEIPADLTDLARKMNVNLVRLPDVNQRLENWRTDLIDHLAKAMPNYPITYNQYHEEATFLNYDFAMYKTAVRNLLLQRGYTLAQVDEVLPPERHQAVGENPYSLARRAFGLVPGVDLRYEEHVESLAQFREILYKALIDARTELLDGSEFDRLREDVAKLRGQRKSTGEIFEYLKEKSIIPRLAETPERAIDRRIEEVLEVKGQIVLMKIEGKSPSQILEYLKANSINLRLETTDQAIERKLEEITALRFEIARMRHEEKTTLQIFEFLKTKSIIVLPTDEYPRDALDRKAEEYEAIKVTYEKRKADKKTPPELIEYLRARGIRLEQETPKQATMRQIEEYKALKARVSELRRAGAKPEVLGTVLRVNSIAVQSLETPESMIERTKKERIYTSAQIAEMKDSPYAAMVDRAILKILEMATLEVSSSGEETLVLLNEPLDLKLSLRHNLYGIFQKLCDIHDRTTQFSADQWKILRRLLSRNDIGPDQLIDSAAVASQNPAGLQISVKRVGVVKDAYRKIVALQDTVDRSIIQSNNSGIVDTLNFAHAFQS